jgi:ketosteroid isomerase-like protein
MTDALDTWMAGYRRAWQSNDPAEIGALFTDDALYYNEPFTPPARGRADIVANWVRRADEPGQTTFTWATLVDTDAVAVVQGETGYPDRRYSNLWVIRLTGDGRASEFTEWWMEQDLADGGQPAP